MTATPSSTISLSVERLKEYLFTLFHHVFWKRAIFEGVPVMDFLVPKVPKMPWDLESMWKKFHKFLKKIGNFWRNFVSPLFHSLSNLLLVDQALLNLTTRWRSSTPDYCKILLIWPWTKVLKVSIVKIYVKSNLDTYNILQIPFKMFFKATYHTWNRIFSSSSVLWCTVLTEVSFLMVPVFCDQVVAKLVVQSDTGKRNLEISLDIVRENCTERFYIVSSAGFQEMH